MKVVWFEYFEYFVRKNTKKTITWFRVDADKENKVHAIDRDCKCKFSYTWLNNVVKIKQESGQSTTHTN